MYKRQLLFTFKSAGLPVLLIIVIQGSIWINFSVPYLQHTPLYFLGYLIVNSIQMGANIDYAIVISSHYTDLKKVMRPREAIVAALNESFPTIFTSGSILASAGILISVLTTNPVISAIGTCLGRGTIVSILSLIHICCPGRRAADGGGNGSRLRPPAVTGNAAMPARGASASAFGARPSKFYKNFCKTA